MLDDTNFPITNTMYGALCSAVSIPNMFIPFFGGHVLDRRGHSSILIFLTWICVGQAIFAYAMGAKMFWVAMAGRIIFGIGEGCVVAGARAIVSHWFDNSELTFAMGTMVAITNISKIVANTTVAPIAYYFGSYVYAFWYGLVVCGMSFLFALIVARATRRLKKLKQKVKHQLRCGLSPIDEDLQWLTTYCKSSKKKQKLLDEAFSKKVEINAMWTFPLLVRQN